MKHGGGKREQLIRSLSNLENLDLKTPSDYSGVPNVQSQNAWLFAYAKERKDSDIKTLWKLFIAIHSNEENAKLEQLFNSALEVKQTAIGKLSQMMFILFPSQFFPIDGQTKYWLIENNLLDSKKKIVWSDYKAIFDELSERFHYSFPELSHRCWFTNTYNLNVKNLDTLLETCYLRISESNDEIKGFINHSKKQLALEIGVEKDKSTDQNDVDSDNFNIILEHKLDVQIPYTWRILDNSTLNQKNAPNLFNKEVCVFQIENGSHSWSDILHLLDLYDERNLSQKKSFIDDANTRIDTKKMREH